MPDLTLDLFDGARLVAQIPAVGPPKSGEAIRATVRGAKVGKLYGAALINAEGRSWRYSAEVTEVAGGVAELTLSMLGIGNVPRWPPKKRR